MSRSKPQNLTNDEMLSLTCEEAFFCSHAMGCLQVKYDGKFLNLDQMWKLFRKCSEDFLPFYVAYFHFRSIGWVVKVINV